MDDKLRLAPELLQRFRALDTTCLSDANDKLGLPACGLYHIRPAVPGRTCCGQAFTVHYVPCGSVRGTVGDFLDDVEPGQVVVIDNAGRDWCTVWGDIMSLDASLKGIAGTVIDGVCRDLPAIEAMGYPIFSKGAYMVTGKDRVYVDAVERPVSVSGVQVCPGDVVAADDSGAICLPLEHAVEVLEIAEGIARTEAEIEALVRQGVPLKEARARTGYHRLQTHEKEEKGGVSNG